MRERQQTLDHGSLESLAYCLGGLFWADLKTHHPSIGNLHLPAGVVGA